MKLKITLLDRSIGRWSTISLLLLCANVVIAQSLATSNLDYLYQRYGQTQKTLPEKSETNQVSISQALDYLKQKFEVNFSYLDDLKSMHKISAEVFESKELDLILDKIFNDSPFAYKEVDDGFYVIYSVRRKNKIMSKIKSIPSSDNMPVEQQRKPYKKVDYLPSGQRLFKEIKEIAFSVSGQVTDQEGEPLIGVNILVKGTNQGTSTDFEGKFTLNDIDENAVLVVSYVGYQTQEISVAGKSSMMITLISDSQLLDEVVVVGYGTKRKKDLTGSISHLNIKAFQNQSMAQMTDMLAGTIAGLQITKEGSAAGGGSLLIRGRKSLSGGTSPLIILDGAIFSGSLSDINPNDIASIDVMKDASSAAVYGASAAAGVVLVTTKKGEMGKPIINFSSKFGIATTTHDLKPFGPEDYFNVHRDYWTQKTANGGERPFGYYYSPNDLPDGISLEEWRNMGDLSELSDEELWLARLNAYPIEIENYMAGKTIDFYSEVIRPATQQEYNLSIGGRSNEVQYYFSGGYLNNEGIIRGDEFKALRMRLNMEFTITEWLSVGVNSHFGSRDRSVVPASLGLMSLQSPYGSIWNDDGTLNKYPNGYTGISNPLENYYLQNRLNKSNSLFSNLYAFASLPYGFEYKVNFQPKLSFWNDYNYWDPKTIVGGNNHVGGYSSRSENKSYEWRLENIITWSKKIGQNRFDVTLLASSEVNKGWSTFNDNSNFAPNGALRFHALQFGDSPSLSNNDSWSSGNSFMGRLNYILLDRYLITGSVRRDGYSAFGKENPFALFPAIAMGWIISEEPFFNVSFIDFMKLRLSQGSNGNREIGIYSALARMTSIIDYDGSVRTGVYNSTLSNIDLKWEKTRSSNIGLDLKLFQEKIDISIDAYVSQTENLLMDRRLPIITGFNSITANLGQLNNRGFGISIHSENLEREKFRWVSNIVFSLNRNKIIKLFGDTGSYKLLGKTRTGELPDYSNLWFPGWASDVVWDYNIKGVWQSDERESASQYRLEPGDYKVEDVNEDGKLLQFDDKKFIGNTLPQYNIGIRNEFFIFENLYASIFLRADLGHIRSISRLTSNNSVLDRTNIWSWPYWSIQNPKNEFGRYVFPDNLAQYEGGLRVFKPTGFLRVQDVSISYEFADEILQKLKFRKLRLFGSVNNFLTFTNWPGFDPESGMNPMPKTFTIGIDISL